MPRFCPRIQCCSSQSHVHRTDTAVPHLYRTGTKPVVLILYYKSLYKKPSLINFPSLIPSPPPLNPGLEAVRNSRLRNTRLNARTASARGFCSYGRRSPLKNIRARGRIIFLFSPRAAPARARAENKANQQCHFKSSRCLIELLGTDSCRGTVPMEPPMSNSSMHHADPDPDLDFDDTRMIISCRGLYVP